MKLDETAFGWKRLIQNSSHRSAIEDQIESSRVLRNALQSLVKPESIGIVAGRKFISFTGEAFLLCRMAWWIGVLSPLAKWEHHYQSTETRIRGESRSSESLTIESPTNLPAQ
jgi:hypothetical protein